MIQREIRSWLRQFTASVPSREPVELAHHVVMLGIAAWPERPDDEVELRDFDAWLRTHQALYARGIIRALKRRRKWAAVKRVLVENQDPIHGGMIATPEYYPVLLQVIRKYG